MSLAVVVDLRRVAERSAVELGFIFNAVRRYWWVVLTCVVALGTLPQFLPNDRTTTAFESEALLLILPPSDSRLPTTNGDDRYINAQLVVLQSRSLAQRVATDLGTGMSIIAIRDAVAFVQVPGTDIVRITATTGSAPATKDLVDRYVALYFSDLRTQVDEVRTPELAVVDQELATLTGQLAETNRQIAALLKPYLPTIGAAADRAPTIPALDQIAPELATQRDLQLTQYSRLQDSANALKIGSTLRVTSRIVQPATLPIVASITTKSPLYTIIGLAAGVLLGAVLAVLLAKVSSTVTDMAEVGEVLGVPPLATLPRERAMARSRRAAVEQLPASWFRIVDSLCVQAEASARRSESFVVIVAGTQRAAGATTVASAMANRFAAGGAQVLLIDVDPRNPELTRLYAQDGAGIPALLGLGAPVRAGGGNVSTTTRVADPFSPTGIDGLRVVGMGPVGEISPLRRQSVTDLVEVAPRHAQVVVFDGGPLLDAASTLQLVELADAAVVAVPLKRQRVRTLRAAARQLQGRHGTLLAVAVPVPRRRTQRRQRRRTNQ